MENIYDVIIIGSGPSGLTAGIYTSRASLKTLMLGGITWGGQLMLTTDVENFPGFPTGIQGPELMMNMRKQAEHHGVQILDANVTGGDFTKRPFTVTAHDGKKYQAKSVIIATGADTKWLGIPGEQEKIGRGVSSCAPCDAAFYRGKNVIVVGGGDSAMEEAQVLTKFASHVWVVHRRDSFKASQVMQDRTLDNEKITVIWNSELTEIMGEQTVNSVKIRTRSNNVLIPVHENKKNLEREIREMNGEEIEKGEGEFVWKMPIDGVFVAIGHIPNSSAFQGIDVDEKGFIKRYDNSRTNIEGVFVAGDVHDHRYKQAITAAGYGCEAALEAEWWLADQS